MGTITAQLFEKEAPGTVANFVALTRGTKAAKDKSGAMTKRPYFNNLTFHRVIPNFMIQTGDGQTGDGSGDCGFTIKDEIVPTLKYDKPGVLGLARLNARNTGACQFFITDKDYPSLNGEYTIFGQVVDGQDVVAKIARVPKDAQRQAAHAGEADQRDDQALRSAASSGSCSGQEIGCARRDRSRRRPRRPRSSRRPRCQTHAIAAVRERSPERRN